MKLRGFLLMVKKRKQRGLRAWEDLRKKADRGKHSLLMMIKKGYVREEQELASKIKDKKELGT